MAKSDNGIVVVETPEEYIERTERSLFDDAEELELEASDERRYLNAGALEASDKLAQGRLHKFSAMNAEVERFFTHFTKNEKWAKGHEFAAIPIDGGQDAKCYHKRIESWVNRDTGAVVIQLAWRTSWMSDDRNLMAFKLLHELLHARCGAVAGAGKDNSEQFGVSANGYHRDEFKVAGLKWFDEFVGDDSDAPKRNSIESNRPLVLSEAAQAKIDAFTWKESVFTILEVAKVSEPRNPSKSERRTCPKHADFYVTVPEANKHIVRCGAEVQSTNAKKIRYCNKVAVAKSKD